MIIAVGSKNNAKYKAVEKTCKDLDIKGISIIKEGSPSGVSSQPISDEETMKGAVNRAEYCLQLLDEAEGITP